MIYTIIKRGVNMLIDLPNNELFNIKHSKDITPIQNNFPMHAHSHYELLYFLSGDITYLVEGNSYTPKPHDILLFNIAETHKVIVNSNKPYERMVIQMDINIFSNIEDTENLFLPFTNKKLGENNIIHPNDFIDNLWEKCLLRLRKHNIENKTELLTYLLPLLNEICNNKNINAVTNEKESIHSRIVQYINDHITEELIPEDVAKYFYISRTALYNIFKEATGTGVHNYINVKRLILSQSLLKSGEKPTKIFEKCGFKDYSTFYRAYKSHFGISPKEYGKKLI